MEINELLEKIDRAIGLLLEKEYNILKRGLNELLLCSHPANYLRPQFEGFDVDTEYNGDIAKIRDRKELEIARNRMVNIGLDPNNSNLYTLTPDIIIHTRNTNNNNLLVFEIKKDSNSQRNKNFDLLKLEHMTIDYNANHYNYRLGVAIVFGTRGNAGNYAIQFFQDGTPREKEHLK